MNKLLFWLTGFLPVRYIDDGERRYLERYYVATIFGLRIYIHRFVGSDPERGLHDHPWSRALSLILSGFYYEHTRSGVRRVRWINTLTGDTFHRVVLPTAGGLDNECWTLFMHPAVDVKKWGFLERDTNSKNPADRIYRAYEYSREGGQKNWWETARTRSQVEDVM